VTPQGKGGFWGLNPQLKHAVANCSQTLSFVLPCGECKRGKRFRFLSNYSGPCYWLVLSSVARNVYQGVASLFLPFPFFLSFFFSLVFSSFLSLLILLFSPSFLLPLLRSRTSKIQLGGLGCAVSSPSRVWGGAVAKIKFGALQL